MAMAAGMMQAELERLSGHGGRLDDAMRLFPAAPLPWIDLSTGINPRPWRPRAPIAHDPAPLPSRESLAALEVAAAGYFGVDPVRVAAVPGSEIALRLLGAIGLPRPIVALRPGYGTHAEVADEVGTLGHGIGKGGTLLLANPNNPDGRLIEPARLRGLAGADGWLVVDEAFVDVVPDHSILRGLDEAAPVIVLRSFGKFFGLAGVRLGFVVAPPAIVARVRALLGDWPVSAEAIACGQAAYADRDWIAAARGALTESAARLDTLLARHGLPVAGGTALFRLVEHSEARAVFARLAETGILTRPFADRADWLRFGLPPDDAAFARLDHALARG